MQLPEMTPCASSMIAAHGYDPTTAKLYVQFSGTGSIYTYANVPAEVYEQMLLAHSVGSFLNANVKPFHAAVKWQPE